MSDDATRSELAERVDAIAIYNARILASRGGGTHYAQMAAHCFAIAAALRARKGPE